MLKHCRTSPQTEFGYRKVGICFADIIIKELLVYHKKLKKKNQIAIKAIRKIHRFYGFKKRKAFPASL